MSYSSEIQIPDSFYMRVETASGGLGSSNLAFARAALSKLKPSEREPEMRSFRRAYLTALFKKRNTVKGDY